MGLFVAMVGCTGEVYHVFESHTVLNDRVVVVVGEEIRDTVGVCVSA